MSVENEDLNRVLNEDRVLASMETMLRCHRRGLCLLKEWMRRYGHPGNGCQCWYVFTESYQEEGPRDLDL